MSSVSSVGNSTLSQWLQALTGNQQNPSVSSSSSPTASATQNSAVDPFQAEAAGEGGHHHHHGGFGKKIESAVTTALQNAPTGSDPNQVIKDAITQALQAGKPGAAGNDGDGDDQNAVSTNSTASGSTTLSTLGTASGNAGFTQFLQSYGVSSQQFQQDVQSAFSGGQSTATGSAAGSASSSETAFSQLLQSYGVSSQQFQQDLQQALTDSSSNGVNFATLFQSFPPGSFLQTVG